MPYCNVCGSEAEFTRQEYEREGYICVNCGTSSRHRAIMYVLGKCLGREVPAAAWSSDKRIKILESSGRSLYPLILDEKFSYYNTEFDPNSDLMKVPTRTSPIFKTLRIPIMNLTTSSLQTCSSIFGKTTRPSVKYSECLNRTAFSL